MKMPFLTTWAALSTDVHLVVLAKIKLLSFGFSNWQFLALILLFTIKIPFATYMPSSIARMIQSLRLFLFRMNRIFSSDAQRWERAFRLIQERMIIDRSEFIWPDENHLILSAMVL